jgi:hypothetical protein
MKASRRCSTFGRLLLCAVPALVVGCGLVASESDSESHFLVTCDSTCPGGLSCVCGKCTKPCEADDSCRALASEARCYTPGKRCQGVTTSSCGVGCTDNADCAVLGAAYRCDGGFCGAGASVVSAGTSTDDLISNGSGESGGGGGTGSAGMAPDVASPECCPGVSLTWEGYRVSEDCSFAKAGPSGFDVPACSNGLGACNDPIRLDGADLSAALADSDVQAAIAVPRIAYGWDAVLDGRPRTMLIGSAQVSIWAHDCAELEEPNSACITIPPGVTRLQDLLDTLAFQQLTVGSCAPRASCYQPREMYCNYYYDAYQLACVGGSPENTCATPPDPEANSFTSLEECTTACSNDPCARGYAYDYTTTSEPECVAKTAGGSGWGRCFQKREHACLCACQVSGQSLEECLVRTDGITVACPDLL